MLGVKQRFHFLYRTTNKVNGKYYIGVHTTWNLDDGYLGSGKRLTRSVRKYGKENFKCEVIQFFENREDAYVAEAVEVESHLGNALCMNLHPGGNGGWSEATKKRKWLQENDPEWIARQWAAKSVRSKKALVDPERRKRFREAGVNASVAAWTGCKHSDGSKRKMAERKRGSCNPQYGTVWIRSSVTLESKRIKKHDPIPEGWELGRHSAVV